MSHQIPRNILSFDDQTLNRTDTIEYFEKTQKTSRYAPKYIKNGTERGVNQNPPLSLPIPHIGTMLVP